MGNAVSQCCCPNGALPPWLGGTRYPQPQFDYDEIDDLEFESFLAGAQNLNNTQNRRESSLGASSFANARLGGFPFSDTLGRHIAGRMGASSGQSPAPLVSGAEVPGGTKTKELLSRLATLFRLRRSYSGASGPLLRGGREGGRTAGGYVPVGANGDYDDLFDDQDEEAPELFSRRFEDEHAREDRRREQEEYDQVQNALSEGMDFSSHLLDVDSNTVSPPSTTPTPNIPAIPPPPSSLSSFPTFRTAQSTFTPTRSDSELEWQSMITPTNDGTITATDPLGTDRGSQSSRSMTPTRNQ
ncbi:hypothetical protein BJ742DRAFT_857178 [Cladochytrium replicatum]|nr:hypothetical protein BJ742DRAFT_857178 [Cladochytrium replicatum]